MLIKLFLIALFLLPAQENSKLVLQVIDEETKQPIDGCAILFGGKAIGITDIAGCFTPTPKHINSIVTLKHLSYNDKEIDLSQLPSTRVLIPLKYNSYDIQGVEVFKKKKKSRYEKMGITKQKPRRDNSGYSIDIKTALYIPNKKPEIRFYINQVYLYVDPRGNPLAPFLLTLYRAEKEYIAPSSQRLLFGPILLNAIKSDAYFTFTLRSEKIEMPKEGLFVVIENPETNRPNYTSKKLDNLKIRTSTNTVYISSTWDEVNKFYLWRSDSRGWRRDTIYWSNFPNRDVVHHGNPMIYVTLIKVEEE